MPLVLDILSTAGKGALGAIVDKVRQKQTLPTGAQNEIVKADPGLAAIEAIAASDNVALVKVKSGWLSRTNWTQFIGGACGIAAAFGLDLDPKDIIAVIVGLQAAQSVVTVILHTFFNHSITPAAAERAAAKGKVV